MSKETRLKKRYAWIEASLRYTGSFDKASYGEHFSINAPQISSDQTNFVCEINELCGCIVEIHRGKIKILDDLPSKPAFRIPSLRDWLKTSRTIKYLDMSHFRRAEPTMKIVQAFMKSIQASSPLRVLIKKKGETEWLNLSPHSLVDIDGEIFARAFDHRSASFKNVPLSKCQEAECTSRKISYVSSSFDDDWGERSSVDVSCPIDEATTRRIIAPKALLAHLN